MQDDVAAQVEAQIAFLHRCRSVFPTLRPELVGQSGFDTARYYQTLGLGMSFRFSSPMTPEFIQQFNALGHWINQNFVLRLYAVLESNQLISDKIRIKPVDGNEEVDILRRLRL